MYSCLALDNTRPGTLISKNRIAFIRLLAQTPPKITRFIADARFIASAAIAHQAAFAPNSDEGITPPAKSSFSIL